MISLALPAAQCFGDLHCAAGRAKLPAAACITTPFPKTVVFMIKGLVLCMAAGLHQAVPSSALIPETGAVDVHGSTNTMGMVCTLQKLIYH